VVKFVNFVAFIIALGCFEFLLREISLYYPPHNNKDAIHETGFVIAAYAVFLWASLRWTGIQSDTPDLLTSAAVYASVALTLLIGSASSKTSLFVLLGIILAFGYFSKSVFLPLAAVILLLCFFSVP